MKLLLRVFIIVAGIQVSSLAFAQDEAAKVRLSVWNTKLNMDLAVSQDFLPATKISAGMLGLRYDENVPLIELLLGQKEFKLTLGYWEAMYKGTKQLDLTIDFEGMTFNVSDAVNSKLRIISYDVRAQLNLVAMKKAEMGLVGGVRVFNYYAQIIDQTLGFAASDKTSAGIPYLGAAAEFVFQKQFILGGSVIAFNYSNDKSEFKLNSYIDANFYAELLLGDNLAARVGYNNIQISFESTGADGFNMEHYIKGPYAGIYIAF